ncbi:MAG: Hsp20/alpha crystallin family protein [Planctomycetia bacterium]|nr:Hsp20/alpha crystallin family protein [Planctomycetia bacterium]
MNIIRFGHNGGTGLTRLHRDFHDLFGRFFGDWESQPLETWSWWPALDVAERDESIIVKAELPGLTRDDIDVSVEGNILIISGEKKELEEDKKEEFYHVERRYGTFRRTITLPSDVDPSKIEATYRDGILTVALPKTEEAKPRQIEVKS